LGINIYIYNSYLSIKFGGFTNPHFLAKTFFETLISTGYGDVSKALGEFQLSSGRAAARGLRSFTGLDRSVIAGVPAVHVEHHHFKRQIMVPSGYLT